MRILWRGSRGPVINELQARLKKLGFDPGDIDGIFGSSTAEAVASFQRDRMLISDGIVGPQTFNALSLGPVSPTSPRTRRSKIFVSYSHADEKWLKMFQVHIAPLERTGMVERWDDTEISPGSNWKNEVASAIRSAKVAVLLISPYFMASRFVAESELPPLLAAAEHEGTVVLPVIISPCNTGSLARFQAVNSPSKPLVDLKRGDRDRIWVKLVEAITVALNE